MGTRVEQITVPARFITMTAHFITVLTVLYDLVSYRPESQTSAACGGDVLLRCNNSGT